MEQENDFIVAAVVNSSNISAARYHKSSGTLIVKFSNGKEYSYMNVSPYHGGLFCESPLENSHGKHFAKAIKDRYDCMNHDTCTQIDAIKSPFPDAEIQQAWTEWEFANSSLKLVKPEGNAGNG